MARTRPIKNLEKNIGGITLGQLKDLILQAQKNDKDATILIIDMFNNKLQKSLYQVPFQEREDLSQDLYVKMIEVIGKFQVKE